MNDRRAGGEAALWERGDCGHPLHLSRRGLLRAFSASGLAWITPLAERLARAAERSPRGTPASSLIVLWLAGGPSQLETFDPHPGRNIAGGTGSIATAVRGLQLAEGLEQVAEQMDEIALMRSVVSKEGDHERGTYHLKTGFRPDPTLVHPSLGAVLCHELPEGGTEIPRHVSIFPGPWPARGGYLGDAYDAFQIYDPSQRLADATPRVPVGRFEKRLADLDVVESEFRRGRLAQLDERRTLHRTTIDKAVRMMSSEQLRAFDIGQEPAALRAEFGDTPFGRACLAAVRLIEVGVRCVEVTLNGWDSHVNNHELHRQRKQELDPAFAALLRCLRARDRLAQTVVLCGGEFGRTPQINPAGGRDHWPHGFSLALAGGGIRGGQAVGQTDPEGTQLPPEQGVPVCDVHATILAALGINITRQHITPVGRPIQFSDGQPIQALVG